MHPAQLEIGDVLLCRGDTKRWGFPAYVRSEISIASSSVYTHAAIYIGNGRILDAQVRQGVTVRSVVELLAEATYVAVLRQPFWRNEAAHAALAASRRRCRLVASNTTAEGSSTSF